MKTDRTTPIRQLDVDELRARLDEFEQCHRYDSARLAAAFRDEDGTLHESEGLFRWAQLYDAWRAVADPDD